MKLTEGDAGLAEMADAEDGGRADMGEDVECGLMAGGVDLEDCRGPCWVVTVVVGLPSCDVVVVVVVVVVKEFTGLPLFPADADATGVMVGKGSVSRGGLFLPLSIRDGSHAWP